MAKEKRELLADAEARVAAAGEDALDSSLYNTQKLIHNLRTHQIELEMQNEELRRTEAELAKAHDTYADLYDFAPVGYLTISEKGLVIQANLALAELLEVERHRLINQPFSAFVAAEDQDIYYRQMKETIRTTGSQSCELHLNKADGSTIWADLKTASVRQADSVEIKLLMTVSDISARKQAESELLTMNRELQANDALLKGIIESIPIRVFWKDSNSQILGCNTLFARDAGYSSPEALIGRMDSDMGWRKQANKYRSDDQAIMQSGCSMLDYEEQQTTPDGNTIWLRTSKVPLRDGTDKVIGILGIYDDITETKKAAEALRESEEKYSSLIEGANDGVAIVQDMVFKFCNRAMADITGYSLDELKDMNFLTPIAPEFHDMVSERYRQRLAGANPPNRYTLRFVCKNGIFKDIEVSSIKRFSFKGKPAITLIYRDITAQKHAQKDVVRLFAENRRLSKQLMQSQEDERRYIARELHDELGQSLTAIDTASRLIAMRSKEESVIEKADQIGQITAKLFLDVRSMLVKIRPPMLDSVGLSASLQNLTSHWMRESGTVCSLKITGSTDDFPDIVNIAIYRVLQESLTNISRHASADQVQVTLNRVSWNSHSPYSEDMLKLDIRDNGNGMNLEMTNVMGLGMVGMRERVHVLGGSCSFNSSPGKGMHVSVLVPRDTDSGEAL